MLLHCTCRDIERLKSVQSRALKLIFKLPTLFSSIELFQSYACNTLPVIGIVYFSTITMVKKILLERPPYMPLIESDRSSRSGMLRISAHYSKLFANDLYVTGIRSYNSLPSVLKDITNIDLFKSLLKRFLLTRLSSLLKDGQFAARDLYF